MTWFVAATLAAGGWPGEARLLVERLGSPDYRLRDRADQDLGRLGPSALPALVRGLTAADPEVRARCERLRAAADAADLAARLAAFRGDVGGTSDYGLAGWAEFVAVTGDDAAARGLFAEMSADPDNAALLRATRLPVADLGRAVAARRTRLHALSQTEDDAPVRAYTPTTADIATLMLVETRVPERDAAVGTGQLHPLLYFNGPGRGPADPAFGAVFRKLGARWLDTRDGPTGLAAATRAAAALSLPPADAARHAARVLAADGVPARVKAAALEVVVRSGDRTRLPAVEALFPDGSVLRPAGVRGQPPILLRDAALAAALTLTGRSPGEYGLNPLAPSVTMPFRATAYAFFDSGSSTAAGKRDAAFRKWANDVGTDKPEKPRP